jgi:hypothetical protein
VLDGLRGEERIAEMRRREGISQGIYVQNFLASFRRIHLQQCRCTRLTSDRLLAHSCRWKQSD